MVTIEKLIDDAKCYEVVRELRWPKEVRCPDCNSMDIKKPGHHRPLRVLVNCLYLITLNLSNEQIAAELNLPVNEAQTMTSQLREGILVKKSLLP